MAYNRSFWKDHVTDQDGHVIQQGTLLDQQHFNNIEVGTYDATLAQAVMITAYMALKRSTDNYMEKNDSEVLGEVHTITLKNTAKYPFNTTVNSPTSIPLTKTRKNLYYSVEVTVDNYSGGLPGDIHVSDKTLNGLKISYDGSAKSVTATIRIKGGMA